MFATYTTAKT